jgi:type IV pilus assembly protein PilO
VKPQKRPSSRTIREPAASREPRSIQKADGPAGTSGRHQLKQLPNTHEVAGLLDDISFIATDNGLTLNRINWEPEVKHEFSTELPMRIEVVGTYHELGKFTADMAALPRIVILDSFQLSREGELIGMSMQAKTYKYNGKTVEKKP